MSIKKYIVNLIIENYLNAKEIDTKRTFYSYMLDSYTEKEKDEHGFSWPEYAVMELMEDVYDIYSIRGKIELNKENFYKLSIDDLISYIEKETKKLKANYSGNDFERKRWSYKLRIMTKKMLMSIQSSESDRGISVKNISNNNYGKVYYRSGKFIIEINNSKKNISFSSIDELDMEGYAVD